MASKMLQRCFSILLLAGLVLSFVQPGNVQASAPESDLAQAAEKIESQVLDEMSKEGTTDFFVWMKEKADLRPASRLQTKQEKGEFVFNTLVATANRTQKLLRAFLDGQGVDYESFYISNKILVRGGNLDLAMTIAGLPDVAEITANHQYQLDVPYMLPAAPEGPTVVESNLIFINADDVWAMGVSGQGTVMAGNDTGLDETHPTISRHYRGCLNPPTCSSWDHNFNWWDATGTYPTNPGDGHGHGTHTTGTMVGDDGGTNQIGVAPGAQTVHCKNMTDGGSGSDATFIDCFQWDLAPWDLSHNNPTPSLAPDAINNSWGYSGGNQNQFRDEILALQAAGILVEVSAGNEGSGCASLRSPGDYTEVLTTGSVQHTAPFPGTITSFSSRGPSDLDGNYFPDIMAPGENIRSSLPGNSYGSWSGTSMAGPHATALVGLIWSACPSMAGMVDQTIQLIRDTAVPLTGQNGSNCGGDYTNGPNNDWGVGTIDALAAVQAAISACTGTGTLEGTVSDAVTGLPIPAAHVVAEWSGGGSWEQDADGNGFYSLTVPQGDYVVTGSHPLYTDNSVNAVVYTNTVTTADIALNPRGYLYGYVTDADNGFALEGATVMADDGTTTTTDANGYYEMFLDEGTYGITASMEDYADGFATVEIFAGLPSQRHFALVAAIAFVPAPVHVFLDWQTTDTSAATLYNRMQTPYDFQFAETSGGFNPQLLSQPEYQLAPSVPGYVTTGLAPLDNVLKAGESSGTPQGSWQSRTSTPFAIMDNVYVDYEGKGYLVGGYGGSGGVGIYDPDTNTWTTGAIEPSPQIAYTVDACVGQNANGEGVIVLFNDATSGATTLHRYNIATNTWDTPAVPAGFPANGLWAHDTVSLLRYTGQNVCYITGGATTPGGGNTSALYEYHPDTNTVFNLGNFDYLSGGFDFHASWFVPWVGASGGVCVGGGVNASSVVTNATQCYDIAAGVFNAASADLGTMPSGIWGMAEDILYEDGDYQLWVANGADASFALWPNSAYFSQDDGTWHIGPTTPTTVYRVEGTNIAAADGCSFYVAGGSTGGFTPSTGHNRNFSPDCPPGAGSDVPWLGEDPIAGTVPASGTLTYQGELPITLLFTATTDVGVNQPGDYFATLHVQGDPYLQVPVTMTVLPPANMGQMHGFVLDNCSAAPVEALVSIAGGDPITETMSNKDTGYYSAWLYSGQYEVTFSADGYQSFVSTADITDGGDLWVDVNLVPDRACAAVDPDAIEVWVVEGTAVFTDPAGLDITNDGGLPLNFDLLELDGGFAPGLDGNGSLSTWPGPDGFGYEGETLNYEWIDISTTGTPVPGLSDDSYAGPFNVGFNFPFYGSLQSQFYVSSNGFLSFGSGSSSLSNQCPLPNSNTPDNIIPLMWDDLYPNYTTGGVYYQTFAQCPSGPGACLVLEFLNWSHYAGGTAGTFEVVLFDNGSVRMNFQDSGAELGSGSTTGIEDTNAGSNFGLTYACDSANSIIDNLSVCYAYPGSSGCLAEDVLWFWESPLSGVVDAQSSFNAEIAFTALYTESTPMPLGTYTATLLVMSNDPVNRSLQVPVTMHIVEEFVTPTAAFTAETPVCFGEQVVIDNTSVPGIPPATTYEWDFGDGTTSNEEEPGVHWYDAPGTYMITLTACNDAGCDAYSQEVEVLPLPEAGFSYSAVDLTVTFTNTSSNADAYWWDFGDGITSTLENPVHTYAAGGTYIVTLFAFGECGGSVAEAEVTVVEPPDEADLSLVKEGPETVLAGETFTYTLTVENLGPDEAENVMLTDNLPEEVTFVSATAPCLESEGVVTCDLGVLAADGPVVIEIVVTAPETAGTLTNEALVTSDTLDPDEANNTDSLDTLVEVESPDEADLSVNKEGPVSVATGETFTYTLTVENLGPDEAENVVLTDNLPVGVIFVSATAPCEEASGVVTCELGVLAADGSVVIEIVVIAPETAGTLTNEAAVASDTLDPDETDNIDSFDTLVEAEETLFETYLALVFKN
jgi:uncharacterized repeat protein (TIGR01451 family)